MANNHPLFSALDPNAFNFTSDQVQEQIVSTLKHFLQNISNLYNGTSSLLNLDTYYSSSILPLSSSRTSAQEAISEMSNFTLSMFSETLQKYRHNFSDEDENSSSSPHLNLVLLATLVQLGPYFATLISTLVGGWTLNRFTYKNHLITDVLETVISFLIFLPALPVLFLLFLTVLGIRALASLYLQITSCPSGKYSLLNAVDGFWAYETFGSCSTCLGLYIIEGPCHLEKIRERMKKTVESDLVGGKMTRKLGSFWGFPIWESIPKEEMCMEKYVKEVRVGDGSSCLGEEDVFQVMRTLQDTPFENRAPWEMLVIPRFSYKSGDKLENKEYYAVVYRMHHSIMDGISSANVLHSIMADKPFKFSLDPTHPFGQDKSGNPSRLATSALYFLGLISMPRVAIRNFLLSDNFNNKYYLPGPQLTGPKTLAWSRPLSMNALKGIKNSTRTSIYAVVMSSLGGAFRKYYIKSGEPLPVENFHVLSPIALLPYPDRKPANRFTGVIVPTQVGGCEYQPLERLRKNFANLKELGYSSATFLAIANWYYPAILGLLPLFLHKPVSALLHIKMSLSNVPGPSEDVWIYDGGKIVDIGIWVPIKYALGFGMGLFSYKDKVRASVMGDGAYFPKEGDVKFIMKAFEDELALLGASVGIQDIFWEDD